ncbi:MAG: NAD(P)-dependent oxidoreductase [Magnetococcus sp. MYC-9]
MEHRTLLLGHTGKMGLALQWAFQQIGTVIGYNSATLDATDLEAVGRVVRQCQPHLIINAIAFVGVDFCEKEPALAQHVNTLLPRRLAQLSQELAVPLIHLSGSTVFGDRQEGAWTERHCPSPINVYGVTKLAGDCLVAHHAQQHYIFRLPLLFGPSLQPNQFVEKLLAQAEQGTSSLRVANDVFYSPSYSRDLAARMVQLYQEAIPWGVYHLYNGGDPSLYDLMHEFATHLVLSTEIQPATHRDFPSQGAKPLRVPLSSEKLPPLRPWQEAVADYCQLLKEQRARVC